MHKAIKRFSIDGELADDAGFVRVRDENERLMIQSMRGQGFVPILGFGPFFSTRWVQSRGVYEFKISIYGVKVGSKSWSIEGIDLEGKALPRHTHRPR